MTYPALKYAVVALAAIIVGGVVLSFTNPMFGGRL